MSFGSLNLFFVLVTSVYLLNLNQQVFPIVPPRNELQIWIHFILQSSTHITEHDLMLSNLKVHALKAACVK